MKLFADVEFTAFRDPRMGRLGFPYSPDAKMLSVALVADDGQELYIEVHDQELVKDASDFVLTNVLPQFGLHAATRASSSKEAGHALADFLDRFPGELVVCADYTDDLRFIIEALNEAGPTGELCRRLQFKQVHDLVCAPGAIPLWDAAFKHLEAESVLVRHHALLDARALKRVYAGIVGGEQL